MKALPFLLVSFALAACSTSPPPAPPSVTEDRLATFSSADMFGQHEVPRCKSLLDHYCKSLYSPEARGNLEVKRNLSSIQVLQGETSNQLSQVYLRYARAKLANRRRLPADLVQALEAAGYFGKLERLIHRPPRESMSLAQRLRYERLDSEVGSIWSAAINETVLARADKRFPRFHAIPDSVMPLEFQLEGKRIRRELIVEISTALWKDDRNWDRVEDTFHHLQASFLRVIDRLDISEDLRADWKRRIAEVRLVLPGSSPAIADFECSTTTINAYYYSHLNVLTVCAGDFNSEDIVQTLAHEMAHALGIDRSLYLAQTQSKFGRSLSALRESVCQPEKFSCEEWNRFKGRVGDSLASLRNFRPELPEFNRCLKKRSSTRELDDEGLEDVSQRIITDRLSRLAGNDSFLRIMKPKIPYLDGKVRDNPNYLNPCHYYLWSQGEEPIDDDLTTLLFFTAEYRCDTHAAAATRMAGAIEVAKALTKKVLHETLRMAGEFSSSEVLERAGYASAPDERFADVLGSYATADLLSELPDVWERRNHFLASTSWQCTAPSLASRFPEESSVEKRYVLDAHTEGDQRSMELFSKPIRDTIGCEKDFDFQECRLPFRR